MNYFFFLDHPDKELTTSLDLFNMPPSKTWSKQKLYDVIAHAFYSDGDKWIFHNLGVIKKNEYLSKNKKNLPLSFHNKSVFVSLNKNEIKYSQKLIHENYMNSIPAWRANIKIQSHSTACSYQGEIPSSLTERNLSLVSCSPMIQSNSNIFSYFYLVNLNSHPSKFKFKVNILNKNKETIYSDYFFTNTVNMLDLKHLKKDFNEKMYIFTSEERGGIPIYFSKSKDNKSLSLEHTHPPTEYTIHGNRIFFQKEKKNHWFSK